MLFCMRWGHWIGLNLEPKGQTLALKSFCPSLMFTFTSAAWIQLQTGHLPLAHARHLGLIKSQVDFLT